MPRGAIHQAEALPGEHSLHVTVSVNQARTWADFLETALPAALALAVDEHVALRRATPEDFTECAPLTLLFDRSPARVRGLVLLAPL